MSQHNTQHGFSMIDLVIALALVSILAGVATPNINRWMSTYRLKSASSDIFSHMQLAKMSSVRENRPWSINFTESGYQILDSKGNGIKSVNFNEDYSGRILYKRPTSGATVEANPLIFNPDGTTSTGYVYISNQENTGYYRVGMKYASGNIRVEKWNGSDWE